jgi:hypothetical protein
MARRKQQAPAPAAPAPSPKVRDLRPAIYVALDQILTIVFYIALVKVIPNRLPTACMQLMAIGTAGALIPALGDRGRLVAIVAGSVLLLSVIVLIARVLVSAAFLAGVYGAFGQAAATFALVAVALMIEVVALVPMFQIKYLMSRAGKRAFAS